MTKQLLGQALGKVTAGILCFVLVLFGPAGTFRWWNAWLLMLILFVPMLCAGFVLMAKNPDLLRKRLRMKEEQREQKLVILYSTLMFVGGFAAAGLSFRFRFGSLPAWVSWAAAVVFLVSYAFYAEVLRENAYLSRTVEVQEGQKVISTGLYGIVRHPMYSVTLFLFLSMPLVLGSAVSLL
ncbi:MAG: isoprenylcysteine carboxylmethyltransferase family protein, partial [Faecalibacterium sp.]